MVARKQTETEAIVTFDGSFDGFLCVVFSFYHDKIKPIQIQQQDQVQLTLDGEFHHIETDRDKAARVIKGFRNKVSEEAAHRLYYALMSCENDKYMAIFQYVIMGFKLGHMVDSHLQTDCVRRIHKMSRHVGREAHLLLGFCRFAEINAGGSQAEADVLAQQSNILYATITPKNDVLALVAEHFTQRLMNHVWVIHDKARNQAAIYDGKKFIITHVPQGTQITYAAGEEDIQELWVAFFKALTIEARLNPKLQRQLLPLYFRKNMTEFKPK